MVYDPDPIQQIQLLNCQYDKLATTGTGTDVQLSVLEVGKRKLLDVIVTNNALKVVEDITVIGKATGDGTSDLTFKLFKQRTLFVVVT